MRRNSRARVAQTIETRRCEFSAEISPIFDSFSSFISLGFLLSFLFSLFTFPSLLSCLQREICVILRRGMDALIKFILGHGPFNKIISQVRV